ncbi:DUF1254 domain-containing protein [Microbacterium sp. H1-D42]|uniref:DUF1254 domain-containing protein n=1 Tax=Microbacterium sp. H1-D42 TaxID=2925844 RepID=UPI001F52FC9A|nr:DUF1254 domain-containing protein [Microbacterium sp. H1-D42]UNK70955.1 DUF1254 domain-containing protein [Microbacterium sp. H1-D42]
MTDADLSALSTEAYLYGFPLVFNLDQVQRYVNEGIGANAAAPFNSFSHARTMAGPADTFVSINNDTVYSMAQLDLSVGPLLLHVPDTAGRYYVLQFVDAWTDNFAYVGHRATGTGAGDFLLVPPGWSGEAPAGATVIEFPTRVASIVGRWACAGADDLPAVAALQDATTLTPLDPDAVPVGIPEPAASDSEVLVFFDKLRLWSQAFPGAERDQPLQDSLTPLGINSATQFVTDADPAVVEALTVGYERGAEVLKKVLTSGGSSGVVNGWKLTFHVFDYNLDFFQVGALDDPAFKNTDPKMRIVERAASAAGGLWGNHAYEAAYIMTYVDDRDEQLTGERTYTLHLNPTPPVDAFWSLTMYNLPHFYMVDNPIDRYSIGDRTPGLIYEDDGSLVITISSTEPTEKTARANWLPAPEGGFRPILRMYEPRPAVLDGSFTVPAITRSEA